ncbi:uncharacterized protein LOC117901245 [Drosophila subobscura]|uniref:uncharacterized protein LOC117901245 n=1 Tax=Drosophila subobscura TaxID=7241 RepID=UPI00155A59F9|nr:uncharacterized protein LOC117901245 [Drosophila subobscura]
MYLAVKAIGVECELTPNSAVYRGGLEITSTGPSPPELQNLEDGNDEKNLSTRYYDFQGYEQFKRNIVDTHYIGSTPCKLDDLKRDKSIDNENNDEAMYECEAELDGYEKFELDIVGNHSTALEIGNTNTTEAMHCPTANGTTFYSQCEMGSLCANGD